MRPRITSTLLYLVALLALLAAFDGMMRADKGRLCSSDATAYAGCSEP